MDWTVQTEHIKCVNYIYIVFLFKDSGLIPIVWTAYNPNLIINKWKIALVELFQMLHDIPEWWMTELSDKLKD